MLDKYERLHDMIIVYAIYHKGHVFNADPFSEERRMDFLNRLIQVAREPDQKEDSLEMIPKIPNEEER